MARKVQLLRINNTDNIGLYVFANDKFCLVPKNIDKKIKEKIERTLEVPIYEVSILNTDLIGVFLNGDDNFLLSPEIFNNEREVLENICKEHDVKFVQISDKLNTFGNNILFFKNNIFVNSDYSDSFVDELKKDLDYNIIRINLKELTSIGTVAINLGENLILSQSLKDEDINKFGEILNEEVNVASLGKGSSYIKYNIIGNRKGILISENSSTIEIQNVADLLE